MAPRFDVGQQCYSSEMPYSGFDQQQPLTCDPKQVPSTPLQKINYTIHPNDQFVIQGHPSLQKATNFQKGNFAFFEQTRPEEQVTLMYGTPGIDIESLLLSPQSIPQVQGLQIIDQLIGNVARLEAFFVERGTESDLAALQRLLQFRRAIQTDDPVFDKTVNRKAIINLERGLSSFLKIANLPPKPVKTVVTTEYGLRTIFEDGDILRLGFAEPTTEEIAYWASRSFEEVLEFGCLTYEEEGKIFLDRFRAAIDALKSYKTGEANTRQLTDVLEELFKDCSTRIEYLARSRPDILKQIAERCEAVLAASEEFSLGRLSAAEQGRLLEATVQASLSEILQTQLAMFDVTKRAPLAKSAAEVLSVNIKRIERYIEFLNHVLENSSQNRLEPGRLIRLIDQLQAIQKALQSGIGEAGIPSDIQKILSGYKVAIDLHFIRTDVYAVSREEALITIFVSDKSYAALNLDPSKIRSLSPEQIERLIHELEGLDFDAFWRSWGQDISPVATQPVSAVLEATTEVDELLKLEWSIAQQLHNRTASSPYYNEFRDNLLTVARQLASQVLSGEITQQELEELIKLNTSSQDFRHPLIAIQHYLSGEKTLVSLGIRSGDEAVFVTAAVDKQALVVQNMTRFLSLDRRVSHILSNMTAGNVDDVRFRDGIMSVARALAEQVIFGEITEQEVAAFRNSTSSILEWRSSYSYSTRLFTRKINPDQFGYSTSLRSRRGSSTAASQIGEVLSQVDDAGRKLAEGGELVSQAGRISIWTYLGIGGSIAGVVLGIPGTLYSAGVTIADIFDPKVSWTEVGIDVGLTATAGIGTYYAIGGVLYTGIWYFLTGTVAFAGAPVTIGTGLLVGGTALVYAKEGKREDREAKDFHEIFFQNRTIEQKAKELSRLADKGDDEVVNKTLERLKKWNPELLDPNNPEAQALWRSKVSGEKGEKPFAEEMRDTAKGYWIGSKDDAVSLVVMAQLTGNKEDLKYALSKVDTESYEEFRQGIPNLKPISELKENV